MDLRATSSNSFGMVWFQISTSLPSALKEMAHVPLQVSRWRSVVILVNSLKSTIPASKVLTLTFYPKEPVPATFNIRYYDILLHSTVVENLGIPVCSFSFSAVFSNEDGATCVTDLQPITIEFRDLFQPLPKGLLEKVPLGCVLVIYSNPVGM